MGAQERLQHLFAHDRSDPLFSSQLTMPQLKILLLLYRMGDTSGRELAGLLGVSLATMSGMVDRLVAHDLVTRAEDAHDRRVRRITLSGHGAEMIGKIITAGLEKQARLLRRSAPRSCARCTTACTRWSGWRPRRRRRPPRPNPSLRACPRPGRGTGRRPARRSGWWWATARC
nr:hypothetical protein GCM10020092_015290 [Actinoplanes digitatis]